jgi:hypothetical protein
MGSTACLLCVGAQRHARCCGSHVHQRQGVGSGEGGQEEEQQANLKVPLLHKDGKANLLRELWH